MHRNNWDKPEALYDNSQRRLINYLVVLRRTRASTRTNPNPQFLFSIVKTPEAEQPEDRRISRSNFLSSGQPTLKDFTSESGGPCKPWKYSASKDLTLKVLYF